MTIDPWPFIIAAYALTALGDGSALTLWSWVAMRRAEARGRRL